MNWTQIFASTFLLPVAAGAQTISLSLTSPQNGQNVSPGASINWVINFSISTGGNVGLALLFTDLEQDADNPALLDLSPSSGVPANMANFSRPAGICNPGEGFPTGFMGVRRGPAGAKDVVQIGGGQNTFGVARPPGSGVAENANVVPGVGWGASQLLASGSFTAPSASGTYVYRLANATGNVLTQVVAPPTVTPVIEAGIQLAPGSFSFTIGGTPCPADIDGNGVVDLNDLTSLLSQYGSVSCPACTADIQGNDNDVDLEDLSLLLSSFGSTCP